MSDWRQVSWSTPEQEIWPSEWTDSEQWMGHTAGDKQPFAPWGDRDAEVRCGKHENPTRCCDCDHDARYKWGYKGNWTTFEQARKWDEMDAGIAGLTYLLDEADSEPFAFVDGDDVRDPETGEVYDGFIAVLEKLGESYADVSTSGSGVHVVYRGDLPDGVKQAKLQLSDEPFGSNDDVPVAELYDHSKVCVATGKHLPETPTDVREWDDDALWELLEAHGYEPGETATGAKLDDYEPTAEDADDVTSDPKDIIKAVERLDCKRVAERTIVSEWIDPRGTQHRAFAPVWAGAGYDGTAVFCNSEVFKDTGHRGGKGGPACMAAIDAGLVSDQECPDAVQGDVWWQAVDHLRELGFSIPKFVSPSEQIGTKRQASNDPACEEPDVAETDGGVDSPVESGHEAPETPPEPTPEDDTADDSNGWQAVYEAYCAATDAEEKLPARHGATEVLDETMHWRALVENDVLYCYDDDTGIYRSDGEVRLREKLVAELAEQFKAHEQREIAEQLRGRNMIRHENMGGPDHKIAASNCVIHVERNELRTESHDPSYEFLNRVQTNYDPDADCPLFRSFLKEVVQTESDRKKLQEYAGYCLHHWGLPFHKALFLVGPTASGKSTFLDTIRAMLGSDATTSLTPQQMTEQRFAGAELFGKWANIRNDIPASTVKNTGQFKEITAGDPMKAEEKFKDPFHFEPDAKHMFSANQLPNTNTDDEAFYRRVLLVAFPSTIPRGERDPRLDEKLQDELSGVLNWALEGLQRLLTQGRFTADRSPAETQLTWEKWGDSISRFQQVGLEEASGEHVPKKRAYRAYVAYCEDEGIPTETQIKFTRKLKSEGIEDGRQYVAGDRKRCYLNVQLTGRAEGLLEGDNSSDGGTTPGRDVTDY